MSDSPFDYVIVGGGSAGCAVAARLTEDPTCRVLLLEAGPKRGPLYARVPKAAGRLLVNPRFAWRYPLGSAPDGEPTETWSRGKLLGGSGAVNGLIHVWGGRDDFVQWHDHGGARWSPEALAPTVAMIERRYAELGGPAMASAAGSEVKDAFLASAAALGLPRRDGLVDSNAPGAGYWRWSIARGRRISAADLFLTPARSRPNLTVQTAARVDRVLFHGHKVAGVQCHIGGSSRTVRAGQVILCAGTIGTPTLLMLSGIGPASVLQAAGVPVLVDAPRVGRNLREHRAVLMQFRIHGRDSLNCSLRGPALVVNILRYAVSRGGPLAEGFWDVGAFLRVGAGDGPPDAQIVLGRFVGDLKTKKLADYPGFQCIGWALRPASEGTLRIVSADPAQAPRIDARFLEHADDQDISRRLFRAMRQIFASSPMADLIAEEITPGPSLATNDEEAILGAFRDTGVSGLHACGTCALGQSATAVVDPMLRVRGVEGLSVADLSILPTMPSANPNATVMAVAWHAAGLIAAG